MSQWTVSEPPIQTRRASIASLLVCVGCCCGREDRGRPPVPVEALKREFKARRLLHRVHLTITGCLGPCDVANVAAIVTGEGTTFVGGLHAEAHFEALLAWATASRDAGTPLPLPPLLAQHAFTRFVAPSPSSTLHPDP